MKKNFEKFLENPKKIFLPKKKKLVTGGDAPFFPIKSDTTFHWILTLIKKSEKNWFFSKKRLTYHFLYVSKIKITHLDPSFLTKKFKTGWGLRYLLCESSSLESAFENFFLRKIFRGSKNAIAFQTQRWSSTKFWSLGKQTKFPSFFVVLSCFFPSFLP